MGVGDTSQTYLLFQTLLLLFCPHSCMIWTKLTRTNAVFSRATCMVYLCAGKWIFRRPRKFPEKYQKIHAPEGARSQKWDQRGALGAPGAPPGAARGGAAPSGRLGAPPLLWCPTETPIYPRDEKTPEQKSFSQFPSRSRRQPPCFFGRANLESALASGEGRSSPSSSPLPLHPSSM